MLCKRIIPCLDIKNGRTVKGINFVGLKDAGNPIELAKRYALEGADELVFLDITATQENRKTLIDLVRQIAAEINIPFTVGGGIRSVEDAATLLQAGADKISINSAAINRPELIHELAQQFGNQCVVLAIDVKLRRNKWKVYSHGGKNNTNLDVLDWVKTGVTLGAGEILLTSMNHDGTKNGFAIQLLERIADTVSVPIIASGGAGTLEHFEAVFQSGKIDAALAASIFHFGEISLPTLKKHLKTKQIAIR